MVANLEVRSNNKNKKNVFESIKLEHFLHMHRKKALWICEKGNKLSDDLGKQKTVGAQSDGSISSLICSLINLSDAG